MDQAVRSYFVAHFGDDISQLRKVHQLVEDTEKEVEALKSKLSERRSTLTAEANGIRRDCDLAVRQAEDLTDDRVVNEISSVKKHLQETRPLADSVSALVKQVEELEKCKKYFQWIDEVNRLRLRGYKIKYKLKLAVVLNMNVFTYYAPMSIPS
jgi:DNA repair exonuclease SbcCD ATPase subunit